MIEVLAISSEIYPLIKTGGLADVVGALPGALSRHDVHVRTLVPGYQQVLDAIEDGRVALEINDLWGGPARLIAGEAGGLELIVIDAPHLYVREGGPYAQPSGEDWLDNPHRFAALAWVGARLSQGMIEGYRPQILHAHDWQAALAPAYLRFGPPTDVKSVMTIHNLAFQGHFGAEIFSMLRLPQHAYAMDGVEYYDGVGFLKAGLRCADALTTVSPTYAGEIRVAGQGMGLDGLLHERTNDLVGILNGIDTEVWNPATDPALAEHYRISTTQLRVGNKRELERQFGLEGSSGPLFGVVSRLTWQKGIDLLVECIDGLVEGGGRLCVLGTGDAELEAALEQAAARHPGRVGVIIGYDEPLSHLVQGGADSIVIPSQFEPCGLTQLFGLRYGCVPLVSRVGGLADTVIDANEVAVDAGVATGVVFSPVTSAALAEAFRRAILLYEQPKVWKKIQRRGMKTDVSWEMSAGRYAALYAKLLGQAA